MDKSDVTLERMRSFVRVVERGSLSAVARELGVGQSTITRHLREIEEAVAVSLLTRTTRRTALTHEGRIYYEQCVRILRLVDQAGEEARSARLSAAGPIRVSCTAAFGVRQLAHLIFAFQDVHPAIAVDLNLTDERIDLVRDGVDLAIRLGPLADSSMKLRSLGSCERLLVASPDYLRARGRPATPADLAEHEGIRMANVAGSDRLHLLGANGKRHAIDFGGRFQVDHGLAAREAVRAGRGIAPAHRWLVDDLLASGELEAILPGYALPAVALSMLIVPERASLARVRLLIDFLAGTIPAIDGIRTTPAEAG